jgi:hypothetical protein
MQAEKLTISLIKKMLMEKSKKHFVLTPDIPQIHLKKVHPALVVPDANHPRVLTRKRLKYRKKSQNQK